MRIGSDHQVSACDVAHLRNELVTYPAPDIVEPYVEGFGEMPHLFVNFRHSDAGAGRAMIDEKEEFRFVKNFLNTKVLESIYDKAACAVLSKTEIHFA